MDDQPATSDRTAHEKAVAQSLALAGRRWRERLNDRLKELGQTGVRLNALEALSARPEGLTQNQLAIELGVENPTIVRLVDTLEAQGWVTRETQRSDRRVKIVRVAPAAEAPLEAGTRAIEALADQVFQDIDSHELELCRRVLALITARLEEAGERRGLAAGAKQPSSSRRSPKAGRGS